MIAQAISWGRCLCVFMLARSDTGAGQPVALIMTRMAAALARIRPRRVWRAARKRERWARNSRSRQRQPRVRPQRETMGFTQNTAMRQKRSGGSEVAVTSGRHAQNDKERQQWVDSDIRGSSQIRSKLWLKHVGAQLRTAGWLCRKPESTG